MGSKSSSVFMVFVLLLKMYLVSSWKVNVVWQSYSTFFTMLDFKHVSYDAISITLAADAG